MGILFYQELKWVDTIAWKPRLCFGSVRVLRNLTFLELRGKIKEICCREIIMYDIIRMSARVRTHTHTHTLTRTHTHTYKHTHTRARAHKHTHAHTYTHTHALTCTHTRTHTYIQTRTHTHTHIRTHSHKFKAYPLVRSRRYKGGTAQNYPKKNLGLQNDCYFLSWKQQITVVTCRCWWFLTDGRQNWISIDDTEKNRHHSCSWNKVHKKRFLGAVPKLRKATLCFIMSVCLSVRTKKKIGSH